ncbi:hypothetical protein FI667_g6583, partial [Globisporangium splendens]
MLLFNFEYDLEEPLIGIGEKVIAVLTRGAREVLQGVSCGYPVEQGTRTCPSVTPSISSDDAPATQLVYKCGHLIPSFLLEQDLLWRYHVAKEDKQEKINMGDMLPNDAAIKRRQERMIMGMTGTLIPDITPRQNNLSGHIGVSSVALERGLSRSSSSKRSLHAVAYDSGDTRSITSKARSTSKTESVCSSRSGSSTALSTSSLMRSIRLQDVQEILESQSRLLKEKTDEQISGMRNALMEEARKREEAERKIHFLCEKLGIKD